MVYSMPELFRDILLYYYCLIISFSFFFYLKLIGKWIFQPAPTLEGPGYRSICSRSSCDLKFNWRLVHCSIIIAHYEVNESSAQHLFIWFILIYVQNLRIISAEIQDVA